MSPEEILKLAYKERGDQIRHYSTVRSALTTFLLTVALAAFSAFFNQTQTHPFLIAAGLIALIAAILACFNFSYLTEKAVLRYKKIWELIVSENTDGMAQAVDYQPPQTAIWDRVRQDRMNWLLVAAATVILVAFCQRDQLQIFFQSVGLL